MSRACSVSLLPMVAMFALLACSRTSASNKSPTQGLLGIGSPTPELAGLDQHGNDHHLAANQGHPFLVYFYPKDGTPGCTKEACAFRDVWQRYKKQGVELFGVSRDDRAAHERFAKEHHIPFTLIADVDGKWANAFGVPSNNVKSSRVSFLFDKSARVARVYPNVDPGVHAEQVLADASSLQ